MKTVHSVLFALVTFAASTVAVRAQVATPDLANATLEELMDIQVTSAARKSQRAEDVPAAIYVITGRDIRQSGLMTLPEILRLAPGVQVAQVSASKWAVSIRGFNSPFSNKLLVLIDGRSVYSRAFSGVFWDLNEVMVSDIDRIEIIRGPGGVAWGANAVNGVISIITRPAAAQQGLDLRVSAGTFARASLGIRYGGTFGDAAYRVFSQCFGTRGLLAGRAEPSLRQLALVDDRSQGRLVARSQRVSGAGALRDKPHQGGMAGSAEPRAWRRADDRRPVACATRRVSLGAGRARGPEARNLQVQAYHTTMRRDEPIIRFTESSSDVDAQYETRIGSRHGLMVGGGYRHVDVSVDNTVTVQMGDNRIETFNTFLQDEISVRRGRGPDARFEVRVRHVRRLGRAAVGSRDLGQRRRASACGPQPRARAARHQTPIALSELNLGVQPGQGLPILLATKGNPNFRSERFVQLEVGHRIRLGTTAALETTVFSGSYDDLSTSEPFPPTLELTPAPPHVLAGVMLDNLLRCPDQRRRAQRPLESAARAGRSKPRTPDCT